MTPVAAHQFLLFPPTRPMAERFGADFFRDIPEAPGVYLMSTVRDGVLYVGKAKNLRRRLNSYRSGTGERLPRKLIRLLLRVERIDWDLCPDEAAALARERELIRALQPRFNTQGVRPPKDWFIGWRQNQDSLTLALSHSLDGWPEVRGPLVFARPAFAALLRSLWLKANPDATITDLPTRLLNGPGPNRWTVPWSEPIARWLEALRRYLNPERPTDASALNRTERPELPPGFGVRQPSAAFRSASTSHAPDELKAIGGQTPKRQRAGALQDAGARSASCADIQSIPEPPPWILVLEEFLELGPWSRELLEPSALSFDAQWRAMDAECLADFRKRLLRGTP